MPLFVIWAASADASAQIKDAESATHGQSAADVQITSTYEFAGFRILQYNLPVLSHYSYMLISGGEACVVDPARDVFAYLDTAKREGVTIKGVLLTHSHADFVAGHVELARTANCPIYVNRASGAGYAHEPVEEGTTIEIGETRLKFVETPGHTPDGMCILAYNRDDLARPQSIFTGDTLFVGSVGRPDLLEGKMTAARLASMMFDTWTDRLTKLGDGTTVLPAHGAGSLCGAHLSDQPSSTIGAERVSNPYLRHRNRSEFVAAVLEGLPEAPQYFAHNAAMNRKGPELVRWDAALPSDVALTDNLTDANTYYVVDIRDAADYAAGHIANSVNIALRGRFESWVGRMVPWATRLVLFGEDAQLKEAVYRLHRVGYSPEVLHVEAYRRAGLPLIQSMLIEPHTLNEQMQAGTAPIVVDVRLPEEWMGLRIGTVVNMPITQLSALCVKLDPSQPVLAVCNSAYRSSMAVGILERRGFETVSSLAGGAEAWVAAGLPVYGAGPTHSGTSAAQPPSRREIRLADRISADDLKRLMMDLPNSFELIDVRPAQHFTDYHLPRSVNVDIAEVLANPAYLTGAGPLIVVDRDGSLAMMVAGILSQKTERTIKALHGGLEAYWRGEMLGPAGASHAPDSRTVVPPAASPPPAPSETPSELVPQAPDKPKKKSAGC